LKIQGVLGFCPFWPNSFEGGTWGCQKIEGVPLFHVCGSMEVLSTILSTFYLHPNALKLVASKKKPNYFYFLPLLVLLFALSIFLCFFLTSFVSS
jgi:hypothetical protein